MSENRKCPACKCISIEVRVNPVFNDETNKVEHEFQLHCDECWIAGPAAPAIGLARVRWDMIQYDMSKDEPKEALKDKVEDDGLPF